MSRYSILLYSNNIKGFIPNTYVKRGVIPIEYDYTNTENLLELFTLIGETITIRKKINRIGIMCHSVANDTLCFFANDIVRNTNETKDMNDFILFIALLKEKYGITNVDLCACSVADPNNNVLQYINNVTGVTVNASTDITGIGGNWVLEIGDVDLTSIYFNKSIKDSNICLTTMGGISPPLPPLTKGAKVLILRRVSYWYNSYGIIININDINNSKFPIVVKFTNVDYNGVNTGNFAVSELLEINP